jgi:putative DNA primase/helicase
VLLIGSGRNGKSVFVKVLVKALGGYAMYAAPDVLMAKEGQRHPTELADLCGARFAALSEVRAGRSFDEETLKRLTGNEPIKARFMRGDFFTFDMTAKMAMAANHRPRVQDSTHSIWDRLREVPFSVRIDEANEDRALYEKLCDELPGILNWIVEGCIAWQRDGLGAPPAVVAATAAYRESEDRIASFFSESVVADATGIASRSQLRAAYEAWCRTSGEKPLDSKAFTEAVRERAKEHKVGGMRLWRGVRLRVESDDRREVGTDAEH